MNAEKDVRKVLKELETESLRCMEKTEELKRKKEELKKIMKQEEEDELKKLEVVSEDKEGVIKEGMESKEEGLWGMNMNEMVKGLEKVNMAGSLFYVLDGLDEHEIPNEVVLKYSESKIYDAFVDLEFRHGNKVDTGYPLKYLDEIAKYMNNEFDIWKLNGIKFMEFCREMMDLYIPFRMDIMNRLFTGFNEYGYRWKNRCIVVNGKEYKVMMNYVRMNELKYDEDDDRIEYTINYKYESIIKSLTKYLENDDDYDYDELIENLDRRTVNLFINEGIIVINNIDKHQFFFPIYSPFLRNTILFGQEYDYYFREWLGNDYDWKLLYRASEHEYSAESFHECCDYKGPTLVIIKSSGGWIFGGYTTQSWSGKGMYYDLI